jgi:hypothetical protein
MAKCVELHPMAKCVELQEIDMALAQYIPQCWKGVPEWKKLGNPWIT